MSHHENLKILAFVGLTGSGKSTAVEHFTDKGYPRVYFGGIAYEIMTERGIPQGEQQEKDFRVNIRETEGEDIYAKRIIDQIHHLADAGQHRIIVDGVYSWAEYKTLKHEFPGEMTTIALVSPKHVRYHRLATRSNRPQTPEVSQERDYNEIEDIQKGGPIAAADYYVANNENVEHFYKQLDDIATHVEF
ncbi:MAG TPA: AAA family ATPase [Candidatus Microsaccharimonas sp.]